MLNVMKWSIIPQDSIVSALGSLQSKSTIGVEFALRYGIIICSGIQVERRLLTRVPFESQTQSKSSFRLEELKI
jgi:hypothetical protein